MLEDVICIWRVCVLTTFHTVHTYMLCEIRMYKDITGESLYIAGTKGLSFISNRQRRKEGTFCASGLTGIEPTSARPNGAGYARLNLSATAGRYILCTYCVHTKPQLQMQIFMDYAVIKKYRRVVLCLRSLISRMMMRGMTIPA